MILQARTVLLRLYSLFLVFTILFPTKSDCGLVRVQKLSSSSPLPVIEAYEVKRYNVDFVNYNHHIYNRGQRSSSLNITRNSELFFGDETAQDSALLLQCDAPYSVQWIYRGDGDPEFNTNATTAMDYSMGGRTYSAHLFLGSRRNLNERETGKYVCTSVRNKNLFSFVYIYVTRSALFTNKGLETVHYSRNDESIRIPCSLSEPRASTTLQKKSHDGVLQCPMNDTVRFDRKQGFLLYPNRLQQPEGTYLCIADYNNTFQIIKYDVIRDEVSNGSSSEHGSGEFEQSPDHEASEFEPGQGGSLPGHIASSTPVPPGNCPKTRITCGLNAVCQSKNNSPERCKCIDGYGGNPYVECRPKDEITTTLQPPPSCNSYDDCPFDRACYQGKCEDPCKVRPICGPHTTCATQHHTPICRCMEDFQGDPYSSQEGQRCEAKSSHCSPNPCGPNSICKYVSGIISCSCEPGFSTHNDAVCRPDQKQALHLLGDGKSNPSQIIQAEGHQKNFNRTAVPKRTTTKEPETISKPNEILHTLTYRPKPVPVKVDIASQKRPSLNGVIIVTTPSPPGKECHYDIDCTDDKMCIQDKCEDPCVNACGSGASCTTRNHFPRCSCGEGTGDPFYKCHPLYSSGRFPSPSNLENDVGNSGRYHVNCGGRYSPCGPNSVCQATRNRFVCACLNNDLGGDPYSSTGCYSATGYQKCKRDEDCPHFLTCLRYKGCVNPCNVLHVCSHGRSCVPHMHAPTCLKIQNSDVNEPRDGLAPVDDDTKDDLEVSEIPEGSTCFVQSSNGRILSPCGRNTICYDTSKNGGGFFCGCVENHIGDPFLGCDPLPSCNNKTQCQASEECTYGFCRSTSILSKTSPCYPTPCQNAADRCAIDRETNSAVCIPPGKSLDSYVPLEKSRNPTKYLSRSDLCVLTGECEEGDNDDGRENDENANTTEPTSDFTVISVTTGASSSRSLSSTTSVEDSSNLNINDTTSTAHSVVDA